MGQHLIIVLTDPDEADQLVVTTMVVTERAHTDKTRTLNVGDHPFIRHPSNIDYGACAFVPRRKLEAALQSGRAVLQADLADELLQSVRSGLLESSRTINAIAEYCRAAFGS